MNFNINQISTLIEKIKNQEIKAVMLCGSDSGLIFQIVNNLSKKLCMALEEIDFNEIFCSSSLAIALNRQDFFFSKKLIKITNVPDNISEDLKSALLKDNLHTAVLIGKNFKATSKTKLKIKEFFEKHGGLALVTCYGLSEYQVKKIIQTRINDAEKIINPDALEYLYFSIHDYQILLKEIEKLLCCYADENVITLNMVKSAISHQYSLVDTQDLTFRLLLNQKTEYFKLLDRMGEDKSLIFYLRGILHNAMQIYHVSAHLQNRPGANVRQIIREKRIFVLFKYLDQFVSVVEKTVSEKGNLLLKLMKQVQKLEILLKTTPRKIPSLEMLIFELHG